MGLFDRQRKRNDKNNLGGLVPPIRFDADGTDGQSEDADVVTAGWDAITATIEAVHSGRREHHMGTIVKYALGGNEPLDGISIMVADDHWHYISYGLSELYAKENDDPEVSGFGFELTFRLAHIGRATQPHIDDVTPPLWPIELMQGLARYVFSTGSILRTNDHIDTSHLLATMESEAGVGVDIPAIAVVQDPQLGSISTPNGTVEFRQLVGISEDELAACKGWNTAGVLGLVRERNPLWFSTASVDRSRFDGSARLAVEEGADREGSSYSQIFAADLSVSGKLKGSGPVTVSFAPVVREEVVLLLRRRIGFGEQFFAIGDDAVFGFAPAKDGKRTELIKDSDGDPMLMMTDADAHELMTRLTQSKSAGGPSTIVMPGCERLTFLVSADDSFYRSQSDL